MMDKLSAFKKSIVAGVLLAGLYALIETGLLGSDFYTFVVIGALAFGVLLLYEVVIYVLKKTA